MNRDYNIKVKSNISWVIEKEGIKIFDSENVLDIFLSYPQAAVWSVVIRHGVSKKSLDILSSVTKLNEIKTREFVGDCLCEWKAKKLLI